MALVASSPSFSTTPIDIAVGHEENQETNVYSHVRNALGKLDEQNKRRLVVQTAYGMWRTILEIPVSARSDAQLEFSRALQRIEMREGLLYKMPSVKAAAELRRLLEDIDHDLSGTTTPLVVQTPERKVRPAVAPGAPRAQRTLVSTTEVPIKKRKLTFSGPGTSCSEKGQGILNNCLLFGSPAAQ